MIQCQQTRIFSLVTCQVIQMKQVHLYILIIRTPCGNMKLFLGLLIRTTCLCQPIIYYTIHNLQCCISYYMYIETNNHDSNYQNTLWKYEIISWPFNQNYMFFLHVCVSQLFISNVCSVVYLTIQKQTTMMKLLKTKVII